MSGSTTALLSIIVERFKIPRSGTSPVVLHKLFVFERRPAEARFASQSMNRPETNPPAEFEDSSGMDIYGGLIPLLRDQLIVNPPLCRRLIPELLKKETSIWILERGFEN